MCECALTCCAVCSCNRYDAQRKAGQFLTERRANVLKACKNWEEMSKFLHYHDRYKEHIKSFEVCYKNIIIACNNCDALIARDTFSG